MNETKRIGIGYTLFEYGKEKRPIRMVKSCPGNVMHELKKLQEKMAREQVKHLLLFCMGSFAYGYMMRILLAV